MENKSIKEEWINGIVMMSPRPQYNHMQIEGKIYMQLEKYFNGKCKVAIKSSLFLTRDNPAELKKDFAKLKELISAKKAEIIPDIAVYCDKEQIFKRGLLGIPQLIVEILSPSNATDDTEIKKETYQKYGVPEYWIADPMTKKVFIYSLENEHYELKGEYKFIEEEVKSSRFADLVADIKDIELFEDDEDDI